MISPFQSGGECLRAFVSVSLDQVAAWQDGQGAYITLAHLSLGEPITRIY